jgi:hypothetical protein
MEFNRQQSLLSSVYDVTCKSQVEKEISINESKENNSFSENSIIQDITEGKKKKTKKLDPVGKEDEDVNNDGAVDKQDEYLLNRRAAIAQAKKSGVATASTAKPRNPKKLLNDERKIEILNILLKEEFDDEQLAHIHDHIEKSGGTPATPESIEELGLTHQRSDNEDSSSYEIHDEDGIGVEINRIDDFNNPKGQPVFSLYPLGHHERTHGNNVKPLGELSEKLGTDMRSKHAKGGMDLGDFVDTHNVPEWKAKPTSYQRSRQYASERRSRKGN